MTFEADGEKTVWTQADWPGITDPHGRFRQWMHMPRPLSRLTLTVTDVRVQRLQGISRGEAMDEACPFANMAAGPSPRDWFRDLWDRLNAQRGYGWDKSPWVAVLTFKAHRCNIDETEAT